MSIELQVEGKRYTQFSSAVVGLRLDALSNTFDFQATSQDGNPLPFVGGESCKVIVDGEPVLSGFIEIVEVDYASDFHNISISGRDKTGDLLDSTLDSISDINAPITMKQLVERIISELGLDIEVIDNANPEPFNQAEDIASPEPGQNAFSFLEQYSRKRQVLLSSNGDGNIVITKSSGEFVNSPLRHKIGSDENNIISGSVSYDTTGRYNLYKFTSALNPIALNFAGVVPISDVVDQKGQINDSGVRAGRQLILISEEAFSDSQNESRARWEANIRKSRGRVYSVVVDGFRGLAGSLWGTNTVVSVVDEFSGIDANMLINSVTFADNLDSGGTTTIGLVDRNAYTLSLEEPKVQKVGNGLFG